MKTCFKCGVSKSLDEFYRHPMMADGHLGKCKECTKKDVSENYRKRFNQYQRYEQLRYQEKVRHEQVLKYMSRHRKKHPERTKARTAVHNAIRDGKLTREPCEVCGAKAQAHHGDYSKPLDARWLCFIHHRMIEHNQLAHLTQ